MCVWSFTAFRGSKDGFALVLFFRWLWYFVMTILLDRMVDRRMKYIETPNQAESHLSSDRSIDGDLPSLFSLIYSSPYDAIFPPSPRLLHPPYSALRGTEINEQSTMHLCACFPGPPRDGNPSPPLLMYCPIPNLAAVLHIKVPRYVFRQAGRPCIRGPPHDSVPHARGRRTPHTRATIRQVRLSLPVHAPRARLIDLVARASSADRWESESGERAEREGVQLCIRQKEPSTGAEKEEEESRGDE
jgi:hypothetical protein